jgi:protein O-GlcNAc transferase
MASTALRQSDPSAEARRQASLHPDRADRQQHLGLTLASTSGIVPAIGALRRVTWLAPGHVDGYINLSIALIEVRRFEGAAAVLRRALVLAPHEADIHHGLGVANAGMAGAGDAEQRFRRGLHLRADSAETMVRLASVLLVLRRPGEAAALERRALSLIPSRGPAHFDLGVALARTERHKEAIAFSLRALALEPRSAQALVNAAASLVLLGRTREAVAYLKQAALADGAGPDPFRNLLAVMSYDPSLGENERWAMACAFQARHAALPSAEAFALSRDPERRVTVGYLSSDLYGHAVARCLEPLLAAHDASRFRLVGYAAGEAVDATTERLRRIVDAWRPVAPLSDKEIAALVRQDQVDILVIVGGRFDRNRPLVASHRAAPIQISLFDGGTSGLGEMDYLLADRILAAPLAQRREKFTERVLRLPSIHLYAPSSTVPPSREPPCAGSGLVTFGCFSNPMKISPEVLGVWARILAAVPGSLLTLKYMRRYDDADLRARIIKGLAVDPARIRFLSGNDSLPEHLRLYDGIDIALDTFPFTGSTTSWEALDMGVPVVTLLGDNIVGRLSASLLQPIGLAELVADDVDGYVRIAKCLAEDRERLAWLRTSLRERIERSPLCNPRARARQFERIYRAVWRRWCSASVPESKDPAC